MSKPYEKILLSKALGMALCIISVAAPFKAEAGVDLQGIVNEIQIAPDGTLWFSIARTSGTADPNAYCKPGWAGLNMSIPANTPKYEYYYGLVLASFTKNAVLYIGNIDVFNGSTACNITQTGYGLLLQK